MTVSATKKSINVTCLHYHEDLEKVPDIMDSICEENECDVVGFRFTYMPLTADSLIPKVYKFGNISYNPTKEELDVLTIKQRKKYATERGISMFASFEAAMIKALRLFENLKKKADNEAKQFQQENQYIVKLIIPASSGVVTKPNKEEHFNFFPYTDVEVSKLIDETFGYKKIDYDED